MTRYLTLAEYLWLAEQVTGIQAVTLAKASRTELADSALHAPEAAFEGHEFYGDLAEKAAVLVCRLAWNHPLPDGNKRAAWASLAMFLAAQPLSSETPRVRGKVRWPHTSAQLPLRPIDAFCSLATVVRFGGEPAWPWAPRPTALRSRSMWWRQ
ncbi:MAG: Fic family protein [Candidatus Dormiibacterota bacterium]